MLQLDVADLDEIILWRASKCLVAFDVDVFVTLMKHPGAKAFLVPHEPTKQTNHSNPAESIAWTPWELRMWMHMDPRVEEKLLVCLMAKWGWL